MNEKQIKNGTPVKITFGMGNSVYGQISDKITNSNGVSYEVITEDGDFEYVSSFVSGNEIGCKLI